MSIYRNFLTAILIVAFASPLFANQAIPTTTNPPTIESPAQTINVNTASAKDLAMVKGLDATKAKAILKYRKKHGDFKSLDDLKKVRLLKKIKLDDLHAIEAQLRL